MNGQKKSYGQVDLVGPYFKSDIPQIKIKYKELIEYAREKNCRVCDLSDEEKNQFITNADMDTIREVAIKLI